MGMIPIGTKYKTRHKEPKLCTVIDRYDTFNSIGELVRTRYVSVHTFCGQTVTEYDVLETTIKMGIIKE